MATATEEHVTATITGAADGMLALFEAMGEQPYALVARRSKRDRLYDLLREAGPNGLKLSEIPPDLPCPAVHMESLRFEGHRIEDYTGQDPETHRFERRWVLREDAWA